MTTSTETNRTVFRNSDGFLSGPNGRLFDSHGLLVDADGNSWTALTEEVIRYFDEDNNEWAVVHAYTVRPATPDERRPYEAHRAHRADAAAQLKRARRLLDDSRAESLEVLTSPGERLEHIVLVDAYFTDTFEVYRTPANEKVVTFGSHGWTKREWVHPWSQELEDAARLVAASN